jgi:hypothetical protein
MFCWESDQNCDLDYDVTGFKCRDNDILNLME